MFKVSLKQCNPFVYDFFIQICDLNESDLLSAKVVINPKAKPINEHRRVHIVNLNELAVLSDQTAPSNDIGVRKRGG